MKKNSLNQYFISPDAFILDAMKQLDALPVKLCLLSEADGRVVRTVTDGDLRRALLNGHGLNSPLSVLAPQKPISVVQGHDPERMLALMREHSIAGLLVTDVEGVAVDVVSRTDLEGKLLLSPPHIGSMEMGFVQRAFDENWVAPAGPNLVQFEKELAALSQRDHALALSSCTAALHLALRVLGVKAGDRVYVSDLTFVASLQPILYERAKPVLIDADPGSWNMSVPALERQLAKDAAAGTLPAVILVVHLYGQSADMNAIGALADHYAIPIVEDAAESLGASYGNKPSGSHGLLSAFSFNGNKIITTSGGGALVSDREDLMDHARKLSTQGRDMAEHYQHSEISYNYRMSNILAGIGIGQLAVLGDRVKRRREIFDLYRAELGDIPGISFQHNSADSEGSRWLSVIAFDPDLIPYHPYVFMRRMRDKGIETRPAWKPMHMQPLCAGCDFMTHSESDAMSSSLFLRSLCLPSGSAMSNNDVKRVVRGIRDILEKD